MTEPGSGSGTQSTPSSSSGMSFFGSTPSSGFGGTNGQSMQNAQATPPAAPETPVRPWEWDAYANKQYSWQQPQTQVQPQQSPVNAQSNFYMDQGHQYYMSQFPQFGSPMQSQRPAFSLSPFVSAPPQPPAHNPAITQFDLPNFSNAMAPVLAQRQAQIQSAWANAVHQLQAAAQQRAEAEAQAHQQAMEMIRPTFNTWEMANPAPQVQGPGYNTDPFMGGGGTIGA